MIIYTSICANYLPKAMALAHSVKQNIPDAIFVVCLSERMIPHSASEYVHFDHVYLASQIGLQLFDEFMFRHSIVEASTAVKAHMLHFLMETWQNENKFIYLDPDIVVYSDFTELRELLDEQSIILAPHLLSSGNIDMEISSLAHGCYNLGFLAVARAENSKKFVQWWSERLYSFCYDDIKRGLFTDQRWIDLVPCFFDTYILKHHGYDFATWSLLGSNLHQTAEGYTVNGDPLRFIHFSGIDSGTIDTAINNWLCSENCETFVQLYAEYKKALFDLGQKTLGKTPWSYDTYTNGEKIALAAREVYRLQAPHERVANPFALTNRDFVPKKDGIAKTVFTLFKKTAQNIREKGVTATIQKASAYTRKHFIKK